MTNENDRDNETTPAENNSNNINSQNLYLDIIKNEYNLENNRKQSFETRAGLILAFLATLSTFLFDKVKLNSLFNAMTSTQPFVVNIKIIAGIVIYVSLGIAIFKAIRIITTKQSGAINVVNINTNRLNNNYQEEIQDLILAYRDIIINRRKINDLSAQNLRHAIYALIALLISIMIYFSIYLKDL
jgi:hypothetical protein